MHSHFRPAETERRMARSLRRIGTATARVPLSELASEAGFSPWHFQRTFRRWVGLSPAQVAAFCRVAQAQGPLRAARSVLDVALDVGLSGPSRLHDQFISVEAMTPGEWAASGLGLQIGWGCGETPLGRALIAWTPRGICRLHFLGDEDPEAALRAEYPAATLRCDHCEAMRLLAQAFTARTAAAPLSLVVRGTHFQIAVWRALLALAAGSVTSYGQLASSLGRPAASRAVGTAVGANPIAVLIPCHRVITAGGLLGGYRWGLERKCVLIAHEQAKVTQSSERRTAR
jgi:AraC family transcriptional regulator of adaptative response/methylated-DNA-[protein]-cysteine methyltransferase